jgi:transposase
MWTKEHRARHEPRLKNMVSACAEEAVAHWLERADPPRSAAATPTLAIVRAIGWHLRVGGPWRALPSHLPPWRTVYGWFRRWLALGLFDRLMCEVAVRRWCAAGRRSTPTLGIIDTQTVKCIAVRGPRGYDAAKLMVGRKRVVLVDADGVWLAINTLPASAQERDTLSALDIGSTHWPSLRLPSSTAPSSLIAAANGPTFMACATLSSAASPGRKVLACCHGAGWSNAVSVGLCIGAVCCATAPDGWMSQADA